MLARERHQVRQSPTGLLSTNTCSSALPLVRHHCHHQLLVPQSLRLGRHLRKVSENQNLLLLLLLLPLPLALLLLLLLHSKKPCKDTLKHFLIISSTLPESTSQTHPKAFPNTS